MPVQRRSTRPFSAKVPGGSFVLLIALRPLFDKELSDLTQRRMDSGRVGQDGRHLGQVPSTVDDDRRLLITSSSVYSAMVDWA